MTMDYWFSVDYSEEEEPNDDMVKKYHGKIHIINIAHEPYDVTVDAIGYSFHLIFGSQINGKFLCIPNWKCGFEIGPYDDELWNLTSVLSSDKISYEYGIAIVKALSLLERFLK